MGVEEYVGTGPWFSQRYPTIGMCYLPVRLGSDIRDSHQEQGG